MRARARAALRWWPFCLGGLWGYGVAAAWHYPWSLAAKIVFTAVSTVMAALSFVVWRAKQRDRLRAEQLIERARRQGIDPCPVCWHYACDGVDCITCDGVCSAPRLTGPLDHASFWLS